MVEGESLLSTPAPGEIYWAFDGAGGKRPFLVVSRIDLNRGGYLLAIPFTTARLNERKLLPNCVYFPRGAFGLPKECIAQAEALTQLRRSDLAEPVNRIGSLSADAMNAVIAAVGNAMGADCAKASSPGATDQR
jgi:mRNA-degrading endonuclease toxin of MazEF toxin-antitoxin module